MSLYIDQEMVATDERVIDRLCGNANDPTIVVGRYELLDSDHDASNSVESSFDLDGRLGMLAYWEIGGPEVVTKHYQRMQIQTTRDEEHVVRSINRARFDIGAITDMPMQGLSVREPSLLYTFDEQEDTKNYTNLMLPSEVKEVLTGLHGKTEVLSPFMHAPMDLSLDDGPFVPLGGNRFSEYKDGSFVPPKLSRIELRQLDELARARSRRVKEAMGHLWSGYKKYAWGKDGIFISVENYIFTLISVSNFGFEHDCIPELLPLSNGGQDNWGGMGTTLVDSLR
jgi:hypothetical protein